MTFAPGELNNPAIPEGFGVIAKKGMDVAVRTDRLNVSRDLADAAPYESVVSDSQLRHQTFVEIAGQADAELGGTRTINYDVLPSTAKPYHSIQPRDLNEQILWHQVVENPSSGTPLPLSNDSRFPASHGWRKMQANHTLPDNTSITVHYQYNVDTDKSYDIKITTPQRDTLQPGKSFINDEN